MADPPRVKACRRASDRRVTPARQHAIGIPSRSASHPGVELAPARDRQEEHCAGRRLRALHRHKRRSVSVPADAPALSKSRESGHELAAPASGVKEAARGVRGDDRSAAPAVVSPTTASGPSIAKAGVPTRGQASGYGSGRPSGTRLKWPSMGHSCAAGLSPRTCASLGGRPRPNRSVARAHTRSQRRSGSLAVNGGLSPEDASRVAVDLVEQRGDVGGRLGVGVAVKAVVAITPVERPVASAHPPAQPRDRACRPLGTVFRAPRRATLDESHGVTLDDRLQPDLVQCVRWDALLAVGGHGRDINRRRRVHDRAGQSGMLGSP